MQVLAKAPSWAVSVAFHMVLLACLGLITFSEYVVKREVPTVIQVASARRKSLELPPERPRGLEASQGLDPSPDAPTVDHESFPRPDAEPSEHDETANNQPYHEALGTPQLSPEPFSTPGFGHGPPSPIGVGPGGSGGGIGGRGGSVSRYAHGRKGERSEDAVIAGLRWLARHQAADGGWHAASFDQCCAPGTACAGGGYAQYDAGVTGLALLAFLGAGYTHLSRDAYQDPHTQKVVRFGDCVKNAVRYLESAQDDDGCYGPRSGEYMYNHAIAALAMAEAYGLTRAAKFRQPAQRGIDFLSVAQNPYRGWRYTVKPGDNDTSVTGWCVMALKSAAISGLDAPHTGFDGARAWIDSVTDDEGEVGYNGKGKIDVLVRGKNDAWSAHPAMTAVGLLCKIFTDPGANAQRADLQRHAARVVKDLPRWDATAAAAGRPIDFYYWYYGTLALFQLDGPDGRHWKKWEEALQSALLPHQKVRRDGCEDGSWDPTVDRWGFAGGRVYATAMNVLTFEVYYRYERVFGARKEERKEDREKK